MTEYKHDYQKFADSAVKGREREEGFGRLRFGLFVAAVGPLAIILLRVLGVEVQKWMAVGVIATAPLGILLLVINFIRLPNDAKASAQALMIAFMTIAAAGGTIAMAKIFELTKLAFPS